MMGLRRRQRRDEWREDCERAGFLYSKPCQGAHLPAEPVSAASRQLASSWPLLDAALRRHWHTYMPARRDGAWSAGLDVAGVAVRVTEPADKLAQAGWQVTSSATQGAITDLSRDAALACADAIIRALAAESQSAGVTG
jgi:hypothetical protein